MKQASRPVFSVAPVLTLMLAACLVHAIPGWGDAAAPKENAFFAMNIHMMDPAHAAPQAQAGVVKQLGYDGFSFLGTPEGLKEAQAAAKAAGTKIYTAYLFPG